jgi:mRNA interferase MazF
MAIMLQNYFLALLDWLRITIRLRDRQHKPLFKEGEIWWCSIGMNVGTEIFGKGQRFTRPVIIFKKFNKDTFLGIPLTSQLKIGKWYASVTHGEKTDTALLAQIRVMDSKRLVERMEAIGDDGFDEIKRSFLDFYGS